MKVTLCGASLTVRGPVVRIHHQIRPICDGIHQKMVLVELTAAFKAHLSTFNAKLECGLSHRAECPTLLKPELHIEEMGLESRI